MGVEAHELDRTDQEFAAATVEDRHLFVAENIPHLVAVRDIDQGVDVLSVVAVVVATAVAAE